MDSFFKDIKNFILHFLDILSLRWTWDSHLRADPDQTKAIYMMFSSFAIYGIILLYYPIKLVFSGEWELNQKISFGDIPGFGALDLRFYAVTMLLGVISGYFLCLKLAKIRGLADTVVDRLFVGMVVFGLIGARFFYVIFNLEDFSDSLLSLFEIYRGGLAVFGMILAGVSYLIWYCWRYKFNFWLFADFIAPAVLLGQIIGRFGNFFNYESYGQPTKVWWGMHVPDSANLDFLTSRYFHPTFLYEIIGNYILFLFILKNYRKLTQKHAGLVLGIYCMGYGLIRSFIEPIRIDPLIFAIPKIGQFPELDLKVSLVSSILLSIAGVAIYIQRKKIYVKYQTVTEIKYK